MALPDTAAQARVIAATIVRARISRSQFRFLDATPHDLFGLDPTNIEQGLATCSTSRPKTSAKMRCAMMYQAIAAQTISTYPATTVRFGYPKWARSSDTCRRMTLAHFCTVSRDATMRFSWLI